MNLEKIREKGKAFAKVVKDEDCHLHSEIGVIETSYLSLNFDFVAVMTEAMKILKEEDFEFNSRRGREFLLALKERFTNPKNYGYKIDEVTELAKAFKDILDIDIYLL